MIKRMPILLGVYLFIFSPLHSQDITGEWFGPSIYLGDSSKLVATKDSLLYYSLGKYPLARPYSYKIIGTKKKHGKTYLFLTQDGYPVIHVIEKFYPDSCLKIYLKDIVYNDFLFFSAKSLDEEFRKKMKDLTKGKLNGLTISFYKKEAFDSFKYLHRFSSINDSLSRESIVNNFIVFREQVLKKFGYQAFEDSRLAQWIYFEFLVTNGLYPFDWFRDIKLIRKQRDWLE